MKSMIEALRRLSEQHGGLDDDSGGDTGKPAMEIDISSAHPSGDDMGDMLNGSDDDFGMDDMPDQSDEGDDAEHNAAVVDILQSEYPDIYQKICRAVGGEDGAADQHGGDQHSEGPSVSAY